MGIDMGDGPDRSVWIALKSRDTAGSHWEILGVFDLQEKAIAASSPGYFFVAPAILNQELPDGANDGWPGLAYANAINTVEVKPLTDAEKQALREAWEIRHRDPHYRPRLLSSNGSMTIAQARAAEGLPAIPSSPPLVAPAATPAPPGGGA